MPSLYTNTVNNWKGYVTYSTGTYATSFDVNITAFGVQAVNHGFGISSGITTTVWMTGVAPWSASGGLHSSYSGNEWTDHWTGSWTKKYERGTSPYTVSLGVSCNNSSGYMNGSASSSAGGGDLTFTVPALDSYSVSFNANGGANAPAKQTKWYGKTLTISTEQPTRNGYTFLGWATSSTGAVAYSPGSSYTVNAATTLYAVWKINYIQPTIRDLSVIRCDSAGAANNNGTYAKVTGSWVVDTTMNAANKATNLKIEYRASTTTTWTSAVSTNPAAASGTINSVIGGGAIGTGSSYYVRVTVTDAGGNNSQQKLIAPQFRTLDIGNNGRTVAIGAPATNTEGFEVGIPARFSKGVYCDKLLINTAGSYVSISDFVVAQGVSGAWRYRKWNSGMAECWLLAVKALNGGDANWPWWGGADVWMRYYPEPLPAVPFPFTFLEVPRIQETLVATGAPGVFPTTRTLATAAATQDTWITSMVVAGNATLNRFIYAAGRYK